MKFIDSHLKVNLKLKLLNGLIEQSKRNYGKILFITTQNVGYMYYSLLLTIITILIINPSKWNQRGKVSKKGNENKVHTNLLLDGEVQKPSQKKFNFWDLVLINIRKGIFDKGYLPNYTIAVLQIAAHYAIHITQYATYTPITWKLSENWWNYW